MTRALPISGLGTESQDPHSAITGLIEVFDPAMCCSTGICGPGVDPALLQAARDLRWLGSRGVRVVRVGLAQEPQAFVANARIQGLLQAFGEGALPAVLVNGEVLTHGRYPTREECLAALGARSAAGPGTDTAGSSTSRSAGAGSCCTPGSGCS